MNDNDIVTMYDLTDGYTTNYIIGNSIGEQYTKIAFGENYVMINGEKFDAERLERILTLAEKLVQEEFPENFI